MGTITIRRDGVELIHTNVLIPRHLRDFAREQGVSMSQELRMALETRMKEGDERNRHATNSTIPAPQFTRD